MGKHGKRQGRGPRGGGRRGGRGPAGSVGGGWADLPRDLLEAVARAVPPGDRLCFRLVCRRWAAAGKAVAPGAGEEQLQPGKVTRTSMQDMAASVARVKMMQCILNSSPILVSTLILIGSTKIPPVGFTKFLGAFLADG